MRCLPHVFASKCGLVHASNGVTMGIHCVDIRPSTKQSHPKQLLVVATSSMSWLFPWQQFSTKRLPLERRYILTVRATPISPRVFTIHSFISCTVIQNILSRPGSRHLIICIVNSWWTKQNLHFGECVPLLQ
jgi:hypothetical protein